MYKFERYRQLGLADHFCAYFMISLFQGTNSMNLC